jgi:glycosyltransferase involved in cell wall biosynthesis
MDNSAHKLRVAHLITQLELGGAQRNTLYTVSHLDRGQYEPILICGEGGILDEEARAGDWLTYFVKWLVRPVHPIKDTIALIALYRLFREIKPHIVHTHSSKAGILGRIAAYLAGVPVIIHTFHGFGFTPGQSKWMRRLFVRLEQFCALLSTHLIFVSKDNEEEAKALGIGTNKTHSLIRSGITIPHPQPLSLKGEGGRRPGEGIRRECGIPDEAWVVATIGNFKPQKNPMDVIKTAKEVLAKDPSVHFLMAGDGELRASVEALAQSEGITSQVHFLGWRQDVPALLAASNCFLLTSLWEGLPRAIVEASAARLPSVAYAVNGVKEIIQDGETGFSIPPHQPEIAAEKILWLKDHPQDAKQMGQKARAAIEKEFDIDRMVRQQESLYKELYEAVPLKDYYEPLWSKPSN